MDLKKDNTLPLICRRCRTRYPEGNRYCICGGLLHTQEGLDFVRACEMLQQIGLAVPGKEKH